MISKLVVSSKIPLLLLYLFPVIVVFSFVAIFSVNVPYWDQWNLINIFEKVATAKLTLSDFFTLNNEHRIAFPLLIFIPLAFISKWNITYELYFSIFLAIISFIALYKLTTLYTDKKLNSKHLTNILTCFLIFSLVQYQNWLWGFQLIWFFINACLVIAVLIIALANKYPGRFYLAAIPCFIASFSSAHGLLTWLAVIPSIASLKGNFKQRLVRTIIWILLFVGTCIIYSIDYRKPTHNNDTLFFIKNPLATINYLLTLLGTPLIHNTVAASIFGLIILSLFVIITIYFVKKSLPKLQLDVAAAAWISIGLFAVLFALMTTVGRASFGVEQGMSSRYTTSSLLLIIAVIQLCRLLHFKNILFAGIIIALLLINSASVIPQAHLVQLQKQTSVTCLELINFIDESPDSCLKELYPSTIEVRKLARIIEKLGFRNYPKNLTFVTQPVKVHGFIDYPSTGGITCILSKTKSTNIPSWVVKPDGYVEPPSSAGEVCTLNKSGGVKLAGWAILPDSKELPKSVFFTYGNKTLFFANAVVDLDSPDVAKALNSSRFNKVRWSTNISPRYLPLGETVIKAWVYDAAKKQLIKLNGEPRIKVVE